MRNITRKVYFWVCNHSQDYPLPLPTIGDTVYCRMCSEYREVKTLGVFEAVCQKKSCTFARLNRPNLEGAIETAKKHVNARNTHEVWVRENDTAVYYVKHREDGPLTQGAALVQASKDSQKILRKFQESLDTVLPREDSSPHDQRRSNPDSPV